MFVHCVNDVGSRMSNRICEKQNKNISIEFILVLFISFNILFYYFVVVAVVVVGVFFCLLISLFMRLFHYM